MHFLKVFLIFIILAYRKLSSADCTSLKILNTKWPHMWLNPSVQGLTNNRKLLLLVCKNHMWRQTWFQAVCNGWNHTGPCWEWDDGGRVKCEEQLLWFSVQLEGVLHVLFAPSVWDNNSELQHVLVSLLGRVVDCSVVTSVSRSHPGILTDKDISSVFRECFFFFFFAFFTLKTAGKSTFPRLSGCFWDIFSGISWCVSLPVFPKRTTLFVCRC